MLRKFRNMAKWGVIALVLAFVATIVLEWGANVSDARGTPYAVQVNGEEIRFEEIENAYSQRIENAGILTDTEQRAIYKAVVDDLIAQRLVVQEARRLGLEATAREIVDQTRERLFRNEHGVLDLGRFARARRDLPASQWAAYEKVIGQDITQWKAYNWVAGGVVITPDDLLDYYNLRYQRAQIRHILIRPGSFVTEDRAKSFYDAHADSFTVAERVRGRHILFRVPPGAPAEQKFAARSLAEAVLLRIQGGEPFSKLFAQARADTVNPVHAEDLDWFHRGQMVPAFDSVAFSWPVGVPTGIIETEFGFHVALFDARQAPHRQAYTEVAEKIRSYLAGESETRRARDLAESLRERVLKGEDFSALARRHSSGHSASQSGLLGDIIPGEMTPELYPDSGSLERIGREVGTIGANRNIVLDPAISHAIFELEVGKISDVIQSGHGFHIVRIERRRGGDPLLWSVFQDRTEREYTEFLKNQLYRDWVASVRAKADIVMAESVRSRMERAN